MTYFPLKAKGFSVAASLALSACATVPTPAPSPDPPAGMQYLYGSGEAAALSVQTYRALVTYVTMQKNMQFRTEGTRHGVLLEKGSTLEEPIFQRCGFKPLAAVFDVDETVLLNLGAEYDDARNGKMYDGARWDRWEKTGGDKVAAVPGALAALRDLRAMGVTVIFNTNRSAANAAATEAALNGAGLGPAQHGDTLFLMGDDNMGSKKDGRRWTIAERYCVVALVGDQLGDFSDLFNAGLSVPARRAATLSGPTANLWGNGWFALPNPVYGSALKGGFDDVFPIDKRWEDPAEKEQN